MSSLLRDIQCLIKIYSPLRPGLVPLRFHYLRQILWILTVCLLITTPSLPIYFLFMFSVEGCVSGVHDWHRFVEVDPWLVFVSRQVMQLSHVTLIVSLCFLWGDPFILQWLVAHALAHDHRRSSLRGRVLFNGLDKRRRMLGMLQEGRDSLGLTFRSSCFKRLILLQRSWRSSSALLRACLAKTNLRCKVSSESSLFGVRPSWSTSSTTTV